MTKWEYKFVWIDIHMNPVLTMARWGVSIPGEKKEREGKDNVERYASELGARGWELVNVISGSDQHGIITKGILFFKRPVGHEV
ncbi:hypothetical protein CH330_02590 [candidate division WOR-3 bacterium JGI_Cruoil_03_51_56]|uniref:DUF4177 domain-containing protein n=1 Tax=candidate division WOR-3 bacterium JGI_Cruoil_03_51_56 TaxID=1973747 RepID=A0A235BVZ8_UNCW3|nr:MAG: hypothetical protein CH330_02590 [candidate division WOR-3 bacterium JGI_Cruoil_03_51_56]